MLNFFYIVVQAPYSPCECPTLGKHIHDQINENTPFNDSFFFFFLKHEKWDALEQYSLSRFVLNFFFIFETVNMIIFLIRNDFK